jgi:hypothetical protein
MAPKPTANGIQRVAASLYNNPDDDFQHIAGTTPANATDPFSQSTSFVERVAAYGQTSTAKDSSVSDREDAREDYGEHDAPPVTSFTVPEEASTARHATTESAAAQPIHAQHVHTSPPANEPLPPANAPVGVGALPEFVPVVTGVPLISSKNV